MTASMTVTDSQKVFMIDCDEDVTVMNDGTDWHASDLAYLAGLAKPKKHDEGLLVPGKKYNVKLMVVIVELPDVLEEKEPTR